MVKWYRFFDFIGKISGKEKISCWIII